MKKIILLFLLVGVFTFSYGAEKILNEEENAITYTNMYKANEDGEMISSEIIEDIFQDIIQYSVSEEQNGKNFDKALYIACNSIYYKVEKWEKQKNGLYYAKKIKAYDMLPYNMNANKKDKKWYQNSKWKYSPGESIYKREWKENGVGIRMSITEKNTITAEGMQTLCLFVGRTNFSGGTIFFIIPLVKDKEDNILQYGMAEFF